MLSRDDISPIHFSSGLIDSIPDDTPQRRQLAIDMMYRGIVSGLMGVVTPAYRNDHGAFFHDISALDPYVGDGIALWHGSDLCATEKLIELVDKYFPKTGPHDRTVNPAFIRELKDTFAENHVPWSDAPLLPVNTNNHSPGA
jgi:hypothetical protein